MTQEKDDVNEDFEKTLDIVSQTIGDVNKDTVEKEAATEGGDDVGDDSGVVEDEPLPAEPTDQESTEQVDVSEQNSEPQDTDNVESWSEVENISNIDQTEQTTSEESNSNSSQTADLNDNNNKVLSTTDDKQDGEANVAENSSVVDMKDRITDDDVDMADMIELSVTGNVDDLDREFINNHARIPDSDIDIEIIGTDYVPEEIELSSDEEDDTNNEVSVVLLKRPPLMEPSNSAGDEVLDDTIEILDSDEEFPVCTLEGDKQENVNIEEKKGFIKEFIEREGLGVIYSE